MLPPSQRIASRCGSPTRPSRCAQRSTSLFARSWVAHHSRMRSASSSPSTAARCRHRPGFDHIAADRYQALGRGAGHRAASAGEQTGERGGIGGAQACVQRGRIQGLPETRAPGARQVHLEDIACGQILKDALHAVEKVLRIVFDNMLGIAPCWPCRLVSRCVDIHEMRSRSPSDPVSASATHSPLARSRRIAAGNAGQRNRTVVSPAEAPGWAYLPGQFEFRSKAHPPRNGQRGSSRAHAALAIRIKCAEEVAWDGWPSSVRVTPCTSSWQAGAIGRQRGPTVLARYPSHGLEQ